MNFFKKLLSIFSNQKSTETSTSQPSVNHGVVKQFNHSRGFGFIYSKAFDRRIFLHISDAEGRPKVGQKVKFLVEKTNKGLRAINVELATQ